MRFSLKTVLANSFLALLVSSIIMFMVFAVRTIIDPLYKNTELIKTSKQIFSIFIWPYNTIETRYIGIGTDFSHRFDPFWSPLGTLLTLIYLAIIGNLIYFIVNYISCRKTNDLDN
jgi:hypothetical protein